MTNNMENVASNIVNKLIEIKQELLKVKTLDNETVDKEKLNLILTNAELDILSLIYYRRVDK